MNSRNTPRWTHLTTHPALTPRRLSGEDWPAVQALLQQVHRRSSTDSYAEEYPLMLGPHSCGVGFGIYNSSSRLVTHVGTLTRTLSWKTWEVKVALIGSVATEPEHEGHGLASRTLQAAHDALTQQGVSLVFLWSEPRRLYAQCGYQPIGRTLLFSLAGKATVQALKTSDWVTLQSSQAAQFLSLQRPAYCTFRRTEAETRQLLQIPHVRLLGWQPHGSLRTVVAVGKGADMRDICHEFWGAEEGVIPLLLSLQNELGRPVGLLLPDLPGTLLGDALRRGLTALELPAALCCILNRERLLESLRPQLLPRTMKDLEVLPDCGEEDNNEGLSLLSALFGPAGYLGGEEIPLPFHAWGLDSM